MSAVFFASTYHPGFYFVWIHDSFFKRVGDGFLAVVDDFGNLVAVRGGV